MKPFPVREVEASVLDDDGLDELSKQDRAGIAFVAIQVKLLLEVANSIGYAAGIDLEIKCRGQLNGLTCMLIRTTVRDSDQSTDDASNGAPTL